MPIIPTIIACITYRFSFGEGEGHQTGMMVNFGGPKHSAIWETTSEDSPLIVPLEQTSSPKLWIGQSPPLAAMPIE
jgi:hypothetical protein